MSRDPIHNSRLIRTFVDGAAVAALSVLVLSVASVSEAGLERVQEAKPVFQDGQAQPVPAFSNANDWIKDQLWVETEFDSDKDGKRDRVHVCVTRQKQTETEGLKVPVIYESSPYFAGTSRGDILWDVKHELGQVPPPRKPSAPVEFNPNRKTISNGLLREWLPRGFAVVHSEAPGTGLSGGSVTVGGAPERLAPKAVIDWLNGRAKGFTTFEGTTEIKATWCTGKVGMIGTSYNGTIPVAAATTGVKGLEAIIPVAPNTSYYHYYRSNGLVRHPGGWLGEDIDSLYDFINSGDPARRARGDELYRNGEFVRGMDRVTGDLNDFWASRDLLRFAKGIKCAVLMAHAFNDWNVVPDHSVRISEAVRGRVPLVQYFHQDGHGGDPPFWLQNKWFSRFLYGLENGVEKGPLAYIVRERAPGANRRERAEPTPYPDFPNPTSAAVTFYPQEGGATVGSLSPAGPMKSSVLESLIDNVELSAPDLAQADASPSRLLYATPTLQKPLHLSGTARVTLRLAANASAANLSVYLVQIPWTKGPIGTDNLITRGWADPQNAKSLVKGGDYQSMLPGEPLQGGKFVTLTFDLQPDDQIIPAGKKIALMLLSSDKDFTLWPKPGTKLTFDLASAKITLPIVGGGKAYLSAIDNP